MRSAGGSTLVGTAGAGAEAAGAPIRSTSKMRVLRKLEGGNALLAGAGTALSSMMLVRGADSGSSKGWWYTSTVGGQDTKRGSAM